MSRCSTLLVNFILFFILSSTLLYPQGNSYLATTQIYKGNFEEKQVINDYVLSYDDILSLLNEIESGELEKKCSSEEMEKINNFVALLAKEGALSDNWTESFSLNNDIVNLLQGRDNLYEDAISFVTPGEYQYMVVPAVLYGQGEVILCRGWIKERWENIKRFVKKHKKVLIIGAAVVVATAVVVVAVTASSATAGAAAAGAAKVAGASSSSNNKTDKKDYKEESLRTEVSTDVLPSMTTAHEAPILKSTINDHVCSFKDNIVQNQFFQPINSFDGYQEFLWEENGRVLGSLLAHDSFNNLQNQIPYSPRLAKEIEDIDSKYIFSIPGGYQEALNGHHEIDRKFSTDYAFIYSNPGEEVDFNALFYQARGERALARGSYNQAVQDLGKAIEVNPTNPISYLKRGVAHFGLGEYDDSLADYHEFTSHVQKAHSLSATEFSLGLAKGLPRGAYESGKGVLLFMSEFVKHPIQTSEQVIDSVNSLIQLVRNDEWGVVAEGLSPEMYQLVTEWDFLPSDKKGDLAGYAIGKHGADILLPGALAKVASKSVKNAKELAAVCKNLQIAQETLVLETAVDIGGAAKIAEVVESGQSTARLADELGFTTSEIGKLKQAKKLETTVFNTFENISKNPAARESFELFDRAQKSLKPYKEFMSETQCRELIHKTGISTFPRPAGVPENFKVRISDKGAGMIYVHPEHLHTSIRVMPGKSHSSLPYQQKPYVIYRKNGKTLDKFGNAVDSTAPEAHIPIEEFLFED